MTKTKTSSKKPAKSSVAELDLHKEIIEEFIEKGKASGLLSYEEIISFSDKNNLTDQEINEVLRVFEKENVEVATQDELEGSDLKKEVDFEELEPSHLKLKAKIDSY